MSTASSSRPQTSNRPTTSGGGYYSQDTGYSYSNEHSFDEEEESEEEDVFAFVPPTTADPNNDQSILQSSPHHIQDPAPTQVHVSFPSPAHDLHGKYSEQSSAAAGPSNMSGVLALHHLHNTPPQRTPVDTPPSTGSGCTDDPYRLRRVATATNSAHESSRHSVVSSKGESRQIHVSLPTTSEKVHEEPPLGYSAKPPYPMSTLNSSPSIMEDDSQAESIK